MASIDDNEILRVAQANGFKRFGERLVAADGGVSGEATRSLVATVRAMLANEDSKASREPLRPILPIGLLRSAKESLASLDDAYPNDDMPGNVRSALVFLRDELIPALAPKAHGEICPICRNGWLSYVWLNPTTRGGQCDHCLGEFVNGKQMDANLFDHLRMEVERLRMEVERLTGSTAAPSAPCSGQCASGCSSGQSTGCSCAA